MRNNVFLISVLVLLALAFDFADAAGVAASKPTESLSFLKQTENSLVELSDVICPQVVAISASREVRYSRAYQKDNEKKPILIAIRGSGCILSSGGLILTNEHVVRNTREIQVMLWDGREFDAKIIGADPRNDLAVLKIDAGKLPAIKFGDLSRVKRGQFVLAVGNPLGLASDGKSAVSLGVISAIGRHIPDIDHDVDRYYGNLILSTAPISIGNSGGPIFNLDGEVVGINTIVSSANNGGSQLAFAIPIYEWTRQVIDTIRLGKEMEYGYVGISLGNKKGDLGAVVLDILKDTPADKAGIRRGDLITICNNQPVKNADHLIMLIGQTVPGKKISLLIKRKNATIGISLIAGLRRDYILPSVSVGPKTINKK